jgi:hypothetical protein
MHLEDEVVLNEFDDDLLGVGLWQRLGEDLSAQWRYSRLEGDSRDVDARVSWYEESLDLFVQASYYELMRTQRALSTELDPYYETLFELHPYYQVRFHASKGLGVDTNLDAGLDLRRVLDDEDEGENNREFERYFLRAAHRGLFHESLSASGTFEYWADEDNTSVNSWGLDLTEELTDATRLRFGTFFALYKYNYFLENERNEVRTWYLGLRHEVSDDLRLDARLELEDADLDDFQVLTLGATWRF